jgi:ferredoxin-NADP reductase/DMSO/TMAO reductase YedYZ heme-binding membrane subunit
MTVLTKPSISPSRPQAPPSRSEPWIGGNMPVARLGLILSLLVPIVLLAWDARDHKLGVDPINFAIHTTGFTAVLFLLLSLLVTPVRQVTGWNWLVQFRRSLGVYAFYYACAHLAIYFWWDRGHNLSSTVYEITHRYYLAIGFSSLALMAPLWATSFNAAIRAVGGMWWKRLHRLAYVAAALACIHFYLQSKADKRLPDLFLGILGGLLLWRAVAAILRRVRMPAKAKVGNATTIAAGMKARSWKGQLKVVAMFRETSGVRTFRLAPPDGASLPFAFRAGQFLNLSLDIDGTRHSRSYTIASPPTRDGYIELTVKREEHGRVSQFLHDMLMTGHTVTISAPAGRFTFDPASADGVLLIAGGVGITPVMSILRDLTDKSWSGQIDLVFSVRSAADVIFADELHLLAARHPTLHVHLTITRDAPADWSGRRGRITRDLIKELVPDVANRPAFICGPTAMAASAREELLALGVPPDRITLESFTPAAATPAQDNAVDESAGTATVIFARSDRSAPLPSNKTVLDVAESIGVPIDFQCRSGICGTCRCKLLSGHVTMTMRDALSDADEADGYILACQAHASEDVTIDA